MNTKTHPLSGKCPNAKAVNGLLCAVLLLCATGCGTIFIPSTVEVWVKSNPSGATVYIDGDSLIARTPVVLRANNHRSHVITVEKAGQRKTCTLRARVSAPVVAADVLSLILGAMAVPFVISSIIFEGVDEGIQFLPLIPLSALPIDLVTGKWRRLTERSCYVNLWVTRFQAPSAGAW